MKCYLIQDTFIETFRLIIKMIQDTFIATFWLIIKSELNRWYTSIQRVSYGNTKSPTGKKSVEENRKQTSCIIRYRGKLCLHQVQGQLLSKKLKNQNKNFELVLQLVIVKECSKYLMYNLHTWWKSVENWFAVLTESQT